MTLLEGRRRLTARLLALSCLVAAVLGWVIAPAALAATVAFTFQDPRIVAPSGMSRDTGRSVYWVVNDTDQATGSLYGVKATGATAVVKTFAARLRQAEAVATVGSTVYIGDIGDASATRAYVTVYALTIDNATANSRLPYRAWDLAYPDGAHDAGGMVVGTDGVITVFTSGSSAGVYRSGASLSASGTNKLTRVADAPAGVTDAAKLADGSLVVRTDTAALLLDPSTYAVQGTTALPAAGESLTEALSGTSLLAGGNGAKATVHSVAVPTASATPTPTPTPTPAATPTASQSPEATPTPSVSATPSATASVDPESGAGSSRSGTIWALAGAVALALAAGGVVLLRK